MIAFHRFLDRWPVGPILRQRLDEAREFNEVRVPLRERAGGPRAGAGRRGLVIAFLADLHAGFYMDADDLVRLFARIAAAEPDLVCLGGDLVDSRWPEILLFERALGVVRPSLGVFAIRGNHEYYSDGVEPWTEFLESHAVQVLFNRGQRVEHGAGSVWIAGVDDLTEGEPDLAAALAGRRPDEPTLLLSHHPDLFVPAAEAGVDLQLSGHTHGGQIRLGPWTPLRHSEHGYLEGMHRRGDAHLYVARGAGVTVVPLRIGAAPEVVTVRWG